MATRLRPIGHEDTLSVVDHLDELRTRLIICAAVLVTAFGLCFWQNQALLHLLNKPLEDSTPTGQSAGNSRLGGSAANQAKLRVGVLAAARSLDRVARGGRVGNATDQRNLAQAARGLNAAAAALPKTTPKREPITTGVAEPFTTTMTVAFSFALIFSLPILLYQAYAFVLPAFSTTERRVVLPLMLGIPFLFVAGVLFGYFLVLPPAISFLQNFNDNNFDVLIQAKDYYRFSIFTLLALGLVFQLPVGALALGRVGILTKRMLIDNWRIGVVLIAILAAALPGVDPVTTTLEMVPLLLLFGLSILLVGFAEKRRGRDFDDDVLVLADEDDDDEPAS